MGYLGHSCAGRVWVRATTDDAICREVLNEGEGGRLMFDDDNVLEDKCLH